MYTVSRILLIVLLAIAFVSCTYGRKPGAPKDKTQVQGGGFERYLADAPENYRNHVSKFFNNIPYDSDSSQKVDIMVPDSPGPHPLLIYFHGGGFIGGDKEFIYTSRREDDEFYQTAQVAVKAGIAVASANYTMLKNPNTKGVISALQDGQRVVKFFRYHAKAFNLDPDRIAVFGGSAGGGIALWIATTDENVVVDQNGNKDPYLQASPKVVCAAAFNSQSTYDIDEWFNKVFVDYGVTKETMIVGKEVKRVKAMYHITSMGGMDAPETKEYRNRVDVLGMLDPTDAPIWMGSPKTTARTPKNFQEMLHHPAHVRALKQQSDALGLTDKNYFEVSAYDIESPTKKSMKDFLIEHLTQP